MTHRSCRRSPLVALAGGAPAFALAFALAFGVLLLVGCAGDDSPTQPSDEPEEGLTEEELDAAEEVVDLMNALFQIGATVESAVRDALRPGKSSEDCRTDGNETLAAGEETLVATACPQIGVESFGWGTLGLLLDYGSGCTTLSGYTASGSLQIDVDTTGDEDILVVAFDSFAYEAYAVDGELTASGDSTAWLYAFDGTLTSGADVWDVDAIYGVSVDMNETPTDPEDDIRTITGGGTVENGGVVYSIEIVEPLVMTDGCTYPESGVLAYRVTVAGVTSPSTSVEFGTGDCCTAEVSAGRRSETMDLCTSE